VIELVYWSFLASLLPVGLQVCVKVLSAATEVLAWHDDPPVLLDRHAHLPLHVLAPATGRTEPFQHGH
jgi:hypothetical protein